jgi:hypothetical protein
MYPRGSNGAGQAILDARALGGCLKRETDTVVALKAYERVRLKPAYEVVLMNRTNPPDAILREVHLRTHDQPFARIEDVISHEELDDPEHFRFRSCGPGRVAAQERAEFQYRQCLEQAIRQLGALLLRIPNLGRGDDLRRGEIGEPEQFRRLGFDRGAFGV